MKSYGDIASEKWGPSCRENCALFEQHEKDKGKTANGKDKPAYSGKVTVTMEMFHAIRAQFRAFEKDPRPLRPDAKTRGDEYKDLPFITIKGWGPEKLNDGRYWFKLNSEVALKAENCPVREELRVMQAEQGGAQPQSQPAAAPPPAAPPSDPFARPDPFAKPDPFAR